MGAKTALIFGSIACDNWDFLQPLRSLAPVVICADGGLLCAKAAGFAPDFYIGDGDSGGSLPDGCPGVVLPAEKDETDLQAACRLAAQQGCRSLLLTACTGGRQDHNLANLQLLERLKKIGLEAKILDACNEISLLMPGTTAVSRGEFRYFSLLPISRKLKGLSITGAKYPLENARVRRGDSLTVSNEVTAQTAQITLEKGRAWLIRSERCKG